MTHPDVPGVLASARIENRPELTGFRAIAAAMVFWGHMLQGRVDGPLSALDYGWTGVNLFFALSGFLFTRLYLGEIVAGTFSYRTYMLKRLIRIYPLTILIVTVSILGLGVGNVGLGDALAHYTLIHGWWPYFRFTINAPMWTLTVEEAFYMVAPLLIMICAGIAWGMLRMGKGRHNVLRIAYLLAIWLMCVALGRGSMAYYQDVLFHVTQVWDHGAWLTFFGKSSDFAAGMLVALVAMYVPGITRRHHLAILAVGVAVFVYANWFLEAHGGPVLAGQHKIGTIVMALIGGSGALIILGVQGGHWMSRFLSTRAMVLLGNISFAVYLIQFIPLPGGVKNLGRNLQTALEHNGLPPVLACFVNYVIVNILAAGVFFLFERPVTHWLRTRVLGKKPA